MKLKAGAYYKTTDGKVLGPMVYSKNSRYPWRSAYLGQADYFSFTETGLYSDSNEKHPFNLMHECDKNGLKVSSVAELVKTAQDGLDALWTLKGMPDEAERIVLTFNDDTSTLAKIKDGVLPNTIEVKPKVAFEPFHVAVDLGSWLVRQADANLIQVGCMTFNLKYLHGVLRLLLANGGQAEVVGVDTDRTVVELKVHRTGMVVTIKAGREHAVHRISWGIVDPIWAAVKIQLASEEAA